MNEQLKELKLKQISRLKGRNGIIRNPYYTSIPNGTKVYFGNYLYDNDIQDYLCVLQYDNPNAKFNEDPWTKGFALLDEINFSDKEFSGTGLYLKGVRTERKDKYGSTLALELLNDTKTIYISQSLSSTLLCNDDNSYIGFATDPDEKATYIFKARDEKEGYLLNKANNRIISTADHRELLNNFGNVVEVMQESIVTQDFPDTIFYRLKPTKKVFKDEPTKGKKQKNTGDGLLNRLRTSGVSVDDIEPTINKCYKW